MWRWYTADDKRSATAIVALIITMIIGSEVLDPDHRRDGGRPARRRWD